MNLLWQNIITFPPSLLFRMNPDSPHPYHPTHVPLFTDWFHPIYFEMKMCIALVQIIMRKFVPLKKTP